MGSMWYVPAESGGQQKKLSATTDGRPQAQPIMGELQGGECQTGLGL